MGVYFEQWHLFKIALSFYTRVPVGDLGQVAPEAMRQSSRYLCLVGLVVALFCGGVFSLSMMFFSQPISVVLALAAGVWLTGGFHEDGLADTCDGLGGGWNTTQILSIMKDSRVGVYAVLGLGFVIGLKGLALAALPTSWVLSAFVVAHVGSRWFAILVMWRFDYIRMDDPAKVAMHARHLPQTAWRINTLFVLVVMLWAPWQALVAMLAGSLVTAYLALKLKRWLKGYTGDTLGAIQQLSECAIYLGFLASVQPS